MANLTTNIALSKEASQHLAELAELTKKPTQELAERLIIEAVELEIEDVELSKIIKKRGLNIKMPSGNKPYNIEYSESVIKKDIPALPAKVKSMIKRAIMERLTVDPIGLGKPLNIT